MAVEGTWDQVEAEVNANLQQLERKVVVDSVERNITAIEITAAYDQLCSTSDIQLIDPSNITPNDSILVYQGYNGYFYKTYEGLIDAIDTSEYPSRVTVRSRDIIKKAVENYLASESADPNAAYFTFNNIQAEDAVIQLLTDSQLTTYTVDATAFTIGDPTRNPNYEWRVNLISAADAINEVAKLIGWHFWAYRDRVYFQNQDPTPSGAAVWTYQDGAGSRIKSITVTTSDERLRNRILVFGYDGVHAYPVRKAASPYLPADYYKTAVLSSELYDTQGICNWVADRVLDELNRLTSYVNITVIGNPLLKVGDTIHLQITTLPALQGLTADYFLYGIRSRMTTSEYVMDLALYRGTSDTGWVPGQPGDLGTPDFTYRITRWGDPWYLLSVDASVQPSTFNGDITKMTVTWDWGDGGPTSTGLRRSHRYNTIGTRNVQMTVTDAIGNTTSITKAIVIGTGTGFDQLYTRIIWAASNTLAMCSIDGGETWITQDAGVNLYSVTCHPTDGTKAWWAGADGKVYYTTDQLASLQNVTLQASDAVQSVWADRTDPTILYAGTAAGRLFRSATSGISWTLQSTLASGIVTVVTPASASSVFIFNDSEIAHSANSGVTSETFATFSDTVVDGAFQNYTQYIGVATAVGPYVSTDSGATWPTPSYTSAVTSITISGLDNDDVLSLTPGGAVYKTSVPPTWALQGNLPTNAAGNDIVYDGDLAEVAYAAAGGSNPGILMTYDDGVNWKFLDQTGVTNELAFGPFTPFDFEYTYKRVFVAGIKSGAANVAWTEDIWTVSPTWTENNTGLPSSSILHLHHVRLDPWDTNTAVVIAGTYTANGTLYKNTAVKTGGSWSAILDIATIDSVVGITSVAGYGDSTRVEAVQFCATEQDLIYAIVTHYVVTTVSHRVYLFHSHDAGSTWSAVQMIGTMITAYSRAWDLAVGQHDAQKVYVAMSDTLPGRRVYRSTNGGHSVTSLGLWGYNDAVSLAMPYDGNPNDDEVFIAWNSGLTTKRTINGGSSWSDWDAAGRQTPRRVFATNDGNQAFHVLTRTPATSSNRGLDWTTHANIDAGSGYSAREIDFPVTGKYYALLAHTVNNAGKIYTSSDTDTWTERTGNLDVGEALTMTIDPTL